MVLLNLLESRLLVIMNALVVLNLGHYEHDIELERSRVCSFSQLKALLSRVEGLIVRYSYFAHLDKTNINGRT